jgi:signal transduction histidine kinase
MYVNLPIYQDGNRLVGAVRVAYTVSEIQRKVGRIESTMLYTVLAYGALIVLCTLLLGRTIARPVEHLTEQARKLAEGDLTHAIHPIGSAEIQTLGHTLDNMRQRLERLEYLRRRRVSDVSHEIRTPLASIRAMAETVLAHGDTDPLARQRFLGRIIDQTDRLAAFVNQLLDLEQIESGRVAMQSHEVRLNAVLDTAAQTVEEAARKKGVALDFDQMLGATRVHGDANRLAQVFVNLLENAVRYTPSGGAVRISGGVEGDRVVVDVKDTGCGIPSKDLPYIFERFYRVAKDRAVVSGGAGLGLCIVREIVEAHGGKVTADSKEGEGTTFRVVLPAQEQKERQRVAAGQSRPAPSGGAAHTSIAREEDADGNHHGGGG